MASLTGVNRQKSTYRTKAAFALKPHTTERALTRIPSIFTEEALHLLLLATPLGLHAPGIESPTFDQYPHHLINGACCSISGEDDGILVRAIEVVRNHLSRLLAEVR